MTVSSCLQRLLDKVLKKEYFIVNTNVQTKTQIDSESNL